MSEVPLQLDVTVMKFRIPTTLLAGALLICASWALAAPPHPHPAPPVPPHPANLEQAVKQVQQKTQGHILAADTVSRGRTSVYRIKVLTPQGKVQVMQLHSSPPPRGRANKSDPDQGGH